MNTFFQASAFFICCALGYIKSCDYTCRVNNLKSFIYTIKYLEDEIIFKKTTLPEAIEIIASSKATNAAKVLLEQIILRLKVNTNNSDFYAIWKDEAEKLKDNTAIEDKDLEVVLELGKSLGNSDSIGQKQLFLRVEKLFNDLLHEAQDIASTKGKMYKGLGISAGLILVILLI